MASFVAQSDVAKHNCKFVCKNTSTVKTSTILANNFHLSCTYMYVQSRFVSTGDEEWGMKNKCLTLFWSLEFGIQFVPFNVDVLYKVITLNLSPNSKQTSHSQ